MLATSSINDAIEYHALFKTMQAEKHAADPSFEPLNIACVFSPPAEGDPDVKQIQEDLPTEKEDNAVEPEKKKEALKAIELSIIQSELVQLQKQIREATSKHNAFLEELGLSLLPGAE